MKKYLIISKIFLILLLKLPQVKNFLPKEMRLVESYDDFMRTIHTTDFSVLSLFFNSITCENNCEIIGKILKNYISQMGSLVKTLAVDCKFYGENEQFSMPICSQKHQKHLPLINFFTPPDKRRDKNTNEPIHPKEIVIQPPYNLEKLINKTKYLMPNFRELLNKQEELKNFLRKKNIPNKVILFSNKEETSPMFKGLTSFFKDRLQVLILLYFFSYIILIK